MQLKTDGTLRAVARAKGHWNEKTRKRIETRRTTPLIFVAIASLLVELFDSLVEPESSILLVDSRVYLLTAVGVLV